MKNFLIALLIGGIIGAGIVWYVNERHSEEPPPPTPQSSTGTAMDHIKEAVTNTAASVRVAIDAKLDILHLKSDQIKEELAAKGKVVRNQTREWAADAKEATTDAAITAKIKAKYALDKDVSVMSVSVNTTDGVVTLSGTAPTYEAIAQAMLIAMETEGVQKVISTIQVKSG